MYGGFGKAEIERSYGCVNTRLVKMPLPHNEWIKKYLRFFTWNGIGKNDFFDFGTMFSKENFLKI